MKQLRKKLVVKNFLNFLQKNKIFTCLALTIASAKIACLIKQLGCINECRIDNL